MKEKVLANVEELFIARTHLAVSWLRCKNSAKFLYVYVVAYRW